MLPNRYQVFPGVDMVQVRRGGNLFIDAPVFHRSRWSQDYDQLLDKRPGKGDAGVCYAPGHGVLAAGVPHGQRHAHRHADAGHRRRNGRERLHSLRAGEPEERKLGRTGRCTRSREEGHAVVAEVANDEEIRLAEVREEVCVARRAGRHAAGQSVAAAPADLRDRLPHAGHRRRGASRRLLPPQR